MEKQKYHHILSFLVFTMTLVLLSGCNSGINLSAINLPAAIPTSILKSLIPSSTSPAVTPSLTPSRTPKATFTPAITLTPTGERAIFGPGEVSIPVLLYHHVLIENETNSKYAVELEQFTSEMEYLNNNGFQTINVSEMVEAVNVGTYLPVNPIVITFDDGNRDVYENAFPLLKSMGFTATVYLIAAEIGYSGRLNHEMIQEMADAGWEFGSHSMSHVDLRKARDEIDEVCTSRTTLMKELGLQIQTFAYPFGVTNDRIKQLVRDCGYTSGAGLGLWVTQSPSNIFYYNRREVESRISLDLFKNLLVPPQP